MNAEIRGGSIRVRVAAKHAAEHVVKALGDLLVAIADGPAHHGGAAVANGAQEAAPMRRSATRVPIKSVFP